MTEECNKIYCKNCIYSYADIMANQCSIPALNVINYLDKDHDIIEDLNLQESEFYSIPRNPLMDFSLHLYIKNEEDPSILNYLVYKVYDLFKSYLKYKYEDGVKAFCSVYGTTREQILKSIFESKTIYGKPTLLNKDNNCPFYQDKNSAAHNVMIGLSGLSLTTKNQNKTNITVKDKLKLLICFFVIFSIFSIILKLILN